ncbi:Nucleotide-binding universal stress protein, UspA family [Lentzea fradiae]|uniref:Nucleotide-binding universal stress protein, UspA family n=1 Tax=Lentzea fradiae TaxID=200378 RepID=A0A1G8DPR5_9PSEU|nr:universal stress protein [Lentzea fradiae]SDH59627.1 Nucleotide-binding universal stress protein, UspA family [Lentzea fradiae]
MKGPNAPVVVGVDGSPSALAAVKWAAEDCDRRHLPLRLVHGYGLLVLTYPGVVLDGEEMRQAVEDQAHEWLAEAVSAARAVAPNVEVSTSVVDENGRHVLIAESRDARLMVLGSEGLGNVTGLLLGSTALAVAYHGECPLVVVRGTSVPGGPVVVGVDGSSTREAALAFAFDAASTRGCGLTAVMCWQDFMVEGHRLTIDWGQVEREQNRLLAQRLAGWQEKYPDVDVHRVVMRDRPVRALMRFGAEAQLVVVGSHGHGGFAGMLLGSTSQALVYNSPCPLAIVRPSE